MIGEQLDAGHRQTPHHIGLRIGFFGQQLGGDDTGGIPHPFNVQIGVIGLDGLFELGQLVGLDGGVDNQLGFGLRGEGDAGQQQRAKQLGKSHEDDLVGFASERRRALAHRIFQI